MMKQIFSVLLTILLTVGLLATAIYVPAASDRLMCALMEHHAPAETTGLPAEDYPAMAEMITGYLRGGNEPFQYVYTLEGADCLAFHDYEQQHMEDVQDLFRLCRFAAWLGLGVFVLRGLLRRWLSWRAVRWTLLAVLLMVTAAAVVAVVDFDALFLLFHQVAFINDLWLLNPRTDMLIRLMPIGFFTSYAAIIGGLWLLGMIALLVLATVRINKPQKGE